MLLDPLGMVLTEIRMVDTARNMPINVIITMPCLGPIYVLFTFARRPLGCTRSSHESVHFSLFCDRPRTTTERPRSAHGAPTERGSPNAPTENLENDGDFLGLKKIIVNRLDIDWILVGY